MNIMELVKAIAPECRHEIVGIRPGEKLHEVMILEDDSRHTLEFDEYYIVEPEFHWWSNENHIANGGKPVKEGFRYASDTNNRWLTTKELREMVKDFE